MVAFATEIAEPDRDGGALRYRGVDIEELVGRVPFEQVWGLLVDGTLLPGLAPADDVRGRRSRGGRGRAARAAGGARAAADAPADRPRRRRRRATSSRRASVTALALVGPDRARGDADWRCGSPATTRARPAAVPDRWRGEADPDARPALDAYWITAAEHGMNASTFTARVVASTGADVAAALSAAVGALSGPLHGGAPARVLTMLDEVEREGDATRYVKRVLDRGERLMGFGHRVYRAEDPRARVLRQTARELALRASQTAEAARSAPRSRSSPPASPTACSPPTSSSGRR